MKHFVLNDIDPVKAKNVELFLKEMNDLAMLLSVAEAPSFNEREVTFSEDKTTGEFKKSQGDFEVSFKATFQNGEIIKSQFDLLEDGKNIAAVHHSVQPDRPIDLRVKLNCEGEGLARNELEDNFERDFSHEAHNLMGKSLEELQTKSVEKMDKTKEEDSSDQIHPHTDEKVVQDNSSETMHEPKKELTEEIQKLSERVQKSIRETQQLVQDLSDLCYDLTRGQTAIFTAENLQEEVLENGAKIEYLDVQNDFYQITFRKGSLDDTTEVSFFLEENGDLIFSVYFSSTGNGKITIGDSSNERILNRLKERLL
jgi:gas vesicle protein